MAAMPMYDLSTAPTAGRRTGLYGTIVRFYEWLTNLLFDWMVPYRYLWYIRQVPNAMTIARLAFASGTVIMFVHAMQAGRLIHALWWVLATGALAMTDALDGPLARKLEVAGGIGKVLDPTADKIFVLQVFIAAWWVLLAYIGTALTVMLTAAMLLRAYMDFALIRVRFEAHGQKLDTTATENGKIKVHFDYLFLATSFFGLLAVQPGKLPAPLLVVALVAELLLGAYWGNKSLQDHLRKVR